MKYLISILIVAGGYYYYQNNSSIEINVTDYESLLNKVETSDVTLDEVIFGANKLVGIFCNDADFQKSGGSSVKACLETFEDFKTMCEERVFEDAPNVFNSKEEVVKISKRYSLCVIPS